MSRPSKKDTGSLSSGSRFGFGLKPRKPSLAADSGQDTARDLQGAKNRIATVIRSVAAFLFVGLTLLVSTWLILGLTIFPVVQISGAPWVVKWAAWPEGSVPADSIALVSPEPRETSLSFRFSLLISGSDKSIVKIIAGPGGEYKAGLNRQIYYNDVPTPWLATQPLKTTKLGDNYLAVCISGADCPVGTTTVIPVANVLGEVIGILRPSPSLAPVPTVDPQPIPALPLPPVAEEEEISPFQNPDLSEEVDGVGNRNDRSGGGP